MSRVLHVIPVGISLLTALTTKKVNAGIRTALQEALDPDVLRDQSGSPGVLDPVRAAVRAATNQVSGQLDFSILLPGVAGCLRGLRGQPNLCAEWKSVAVEAADPPPGDPDDSNPAYVFIATDNDEGLRAGAFVAAGFAGDVEVYYVDDPEEEFRSTPIKPRHAYLCRVPGLDLADPNKINDNTWCALGHIGHAIAETARQAKRGRWRVVLHLSGGYKAMIPYLLVMAEGINSVFTTSIRTFEDHEPTLKACALHESAEEFRVDIPVRTLGDGLFSELLDLKVAYDTGTLHNLRSNGLFGLCIDINTRRLTEAGLIMVQVP